MTKIKAKIQLRRDTSANFTSVNPTLLLGEFAFETDTMVVTEGGSVSVKLKIGDGVNPWTELPYTTFGFQAVTWDDISGKPTEFAPAPHTHEITDVIGLETILEAIADSIPDISGLATVVYVDQQDALKVDKVTGKGLSTNDFTNTLKTKLDGIQDGAEVNVNADWNATTGDAEILNKPAIPAGQIQSDWTQSNNAALDFIKNKPTIPASGLPAGGTAGQILTKIDSTDYNANWQENFADWTSQVKHIVKNNGLGGTITKGTAVYVTGSNGTNMLVGRASNASEPTSSKTMGLMQSDITTTGGNQTGFVITEGLLGGLNTAAQTAGDPVWLGVNGALIYGLANKPYAPAHLVFIGIITKVSAGNGEIFVKVQNGFELKEIHDVDLITTTPINGHVLGFDGTLWVNKTIAGWLGFTPEDSANKQNSLATDGAGVKFPTVDAVNGLSFIDKFKRGIQYFTDLEGRGSTVQNFTQLISGAGATTERFVVSVPNASINQIGFCQYQTGTTATGYAVHYNEPNVGAQFFFGGGAWVFETYITVETLSDATNRFRFITGFGTAVTNGSENSGAFFTYDEGATQNGTTATPNWQCQTCVNSVRTLTTTSTVVTAGAWVKLRIEVNAAGTQVLFYINGTLVATHITNIPTWLNFGNPRGFNVKQSINKTVGTLNRSVFCDYFGYENRLTTPR